MEEEQDEVERLKDDVLMARRENARLRRLADWYREQWLGELWNDTGRYDMRIGTDDPEPHLGVPS